MSEQKIKTATNAETKALNRLHVRSRRFENCVNTSREMARKLKETVTKQENEIRLLKEKEKKKKQATIDEYANQKRTTKGNICEHQQQLSEKENVHKNHLERRIRSTNDYLMRMKRNTTSR